MVIPGENCGGIYLESGAVLDVEALNEDAYISVTRDEDGVFALGAAQYIDQFSTDSEHVISVDGDDLRIDKKE